MSLSSPSRSIRSHGLAPVWAALALTLVAGGCEDKHIGRPCDIGLTMIMDPKVVTVNPQALECPSRICVLPAQDRSVDIPESPPPTGALCTFECGNDDDCSDAEKRNLKDTTDTRCRGSFACRTILPKVNNPLSCKRVCVCRDFLRTDDLTNIPPPSCS